MKKKRSRPAGFSLVELLVAIVIVAVLVALLFPAGRWAINVAKDSKCKHRLRQLGVAYQQYSIDNGGAALRDGSSPHEWTRLLQPYFNQETFSSTLPREWTCPAAPARPGAQYYQPDYAANVHGAVSGDQASIGLKPESTGASKIAAQENPSQIIAFLDWIPGWRFARVFEFGQANGADKARVYRHSGRLNAVFADGHVESIAYPIPTDHKSPPWR